MEILYKKKSLFYFVLLLFFSFSGAYLAKITEFSPIYFCFLIGFLAFTIYLIFSGRIANRPEISFITAYIVIIIFYLSLQMVITNSESAAKNYMLNYIFSFIYLPLIICFYKKLKIDLIRSVIRNYLTVSTLFLSADTARRLMIRGNYKLWIYNFKMNGLMFQDSNFTGFFIMINFAFILYLKEKKLIIYTKRYILFQFILICLSFSRAAIIATIFLMFLLFFKKQKFIIKFILSFIFIIILFIYLFVLKEIININKSNIDASGLTKIDIFAGTLQYLKDASMKQLVIGNGLLSSVKILGLAGHNFISTAIIELGTVFLFLQLVLFVFLYVLTKRYFMYILIPYLIAGLSMAPGAIPYFYAIAGMMYLTKDYKPNVRTI